MPVHKKGSGYQWGGHGKVYTGPHAKEKAEAQARAAYANGYRSKDLIKDNHSSAKHVGKKK